MTATYDSTSLPNTGRGSVLLRGAYQFLALVQSLLEQPIQTGHDMQRILLYEIEPIASCLLVRPIC